MTTRGSNGEARWILLIHQIPPKPAYLRVKIWRRLQKLGAVAIKNSVYALPRSDEAQEDLHWLLGEITEGGGEGSIAMAHFVDGLTDDRVESLFQSSREADYRALAEEARSIAGEIRAGQPIPDGRLAEIGTRIARLRKQLADTVEIDFFGAPGRETVEGLLSDLEARTKSEGKREPTRATARPGDYQRRTWVTRSGIFIDRMASAWLIRRFIDPHARFKFVAAKGYRAKPGEIQFDMFEADFTHDGELCTFEVLIDRFGLSDPALRTMAEIVHDVDTKDDKYGRPEAAGIALALSGVAAAQADDEQRLARSAALFDDLHAHFTKKKR